MTGQRQRKRQLRATWAADISRAASLAEAGDTVVTQKSKEDALRRLSLHLSENIGIFGGAGRDRTDDLSSAIAALSQLSYGPRIVAPFRDRPSSLSRRPKATVA